MKAYTKNYSAPLYRKGIKVSDDYKFYNEREQRSVPKLSKTSFSILNSEYEKDKKAQNDKLKENIIKFEPSDRNYIIVKNEKEIHDIIKYLRTVYYDLGHINRAVDLIYTKICSVKQIISDY